MCTGTCNCDISTAPALPELFESTGKRAGDGREVVKLHQGTDSAGGGYGGTKTGTCIVMHECDWEAMDLVYEQLQHQFQVEFVPAKNIKVAKKCMPAHRTRVVLRLASRLGGGGAQDAAVNSTGCDASQEGGGHASAGSATEAALIIELRRLRQEAHQRAVAAETAVQGLQEQLELGAISAEASVLRAEGEAPPSRTSWHRRDGACCGRGGQCHVKCCCVMEDEGSCLKLPRLGWPGGAKDVLRGYFEFVARVIAPEYAKGGMAWRRVVGRSWDLGSCGVSSSASRVLWVVQST